MEKKEKMGEMRRVTHRGRKRKKQLLYRSGNVFADGWLSVPNLP